MKLKIDKIFLSIVCLLFLSIGANLMAIKLAIKPFPKPPSPPSISVVKSSIVPAPIVSTNTHFNLEWTSYTNIDYFILGSTNLMTNWFFVGVTNKSPWPVESTNKSEFFQILAIQN